MKRIFPIVFILAGCNPFPDLDDRITDTARQAPYPTLQPLPDFAPATSVADPALAARVAALQARAARLRQIDIAALQ